MITLVVDGISYQYPQVDDENWGEQATLWASSVSDVLATLRSPTLPTATSGKVRLGNTDRFSWRGFGNTFNVDLYVDVDDKLYVKIGSNPAIDLTANAAGNVTGPGSSTDEAIARYDGTTGQIIQDSVVLISNAGAVSGVTSLSMNSTITGATDITASGTVQSADLHATDDLTVDDDAAILGDLAVTGTATALNVTATATLTGADIHATDDLTVDDDALVSGDLTVTGTSNLVGDVTADVAIFTAVGANTPGWISNLGISYSSGTLTFVSADGSALGASNPGYICMNSTTAGQFKILKVTGSSLTLKDDANASSQFTNFGFGITETAHWAEDLPFFLYAVNKGNANITGSDGDSALFLARSPTLTISPSTSNLIGDQAAIASSDDELSISMLGTYTKANYTGLNCQLIGAIRMQWSTTSDDWTIQALNRNDGLGQTQLNKTFAVEWVMPTGQNGAASGGYLLANSGTAPTFSTQNYIYTIQADGFVKMLISLTGDAGTDGSGSVTTPIALPVEATSATAIGSSLSSFRVDFPSTEFTAFADLNGFSQSTISLRRADVSAGTLLDDQTLIQHAEFTNGSRTIRGSCVYRAFDVNGI